MKYIITINLLFNWPLTQKILTLQKQENLDGRKMFPKSNTYNAKFGFITLKIIFIFICSTLTKKKQLAALNDENSSTVFVYLTS
jgi:hypothetical protein